MTRHANWCIIAAAIVCVATGIGLSHRIEPGVRVDTVTLAGDTPALRFFPAGTEPHPVALLAHGVTASKETLFRFGEGLAAAGFVCFAVDLPGHGESRRLFSRRENAPTLTAVARELGTVDVFIGHSMGAGAGAASVRAHGLSPRLFIAVGAVPDLGPSGPPLLLLEGEFDEAIVWRLGSGGKKPLPLQANQFESSIAPGTNTRVRLFSWCDHAMEPYDPRLVNAAIEAACAAVGRTPPAAPTRWIWRVAGIMLAVAGAFCLGVLAPKIIPRAARVRGLVLALAVIAAVCASAGTWLGAGPNWPRVPGQIVVMIVFWLMLTGAGKLRIPRWIFVAFAGTAAVCGILTGAYFPALIAGISTVGLGAGTVLGETAAHLGSRRDGDIAMAVFVGYAVGQWVPRIF
jgi:pimeloyl-ACP methyl ester carboxylesterase